MKPTLNNLGLPTVYQLKRIALNAAFYFVGSFLSLLQLELMTDTVTAGTLAPAAIFSLLVSAGGSTVKFVYTTLFEPPKEG